MDVYRVQPGERINLSDRDPADKQFFRGGKNEGKQLLYELNRKLESLQELLYAEHKQKVLIVLQAMDTGGKDGTIRHVFEGVNPQGVSVTSFKVPTPDELDHDYLWRVHQHVPGKGQIMIFNRSHYEDVLVVRVHDLVPEQTWSKRFDHINNFERMLLDEGSTILKFFLHISKDEQKQRLQARLNEANKRWKFSSGDLKERKLWPDYQRAYEEMLSETSTDWAPWYIIPANRKWYRNLVISEIIIETLENLNMSYPQSEGNLSGVVVE